MLHLSFFFLMSIFPPLQISNGFLERCLTPSSPATLLVGLDKKKSGMVRRVHCAAATFKHFRVWFLVKLSWAGGKSGPIGMGDLFQTLRTPRILLKWRGVASGCLFQRVVSQSYFCEIVNWAVWQNNHGNSVPINFWGSHICSQCLYLTSFSIFSFDQTYSP